MPLRLVMFNFFGAYLTFAYRAPNELFIELLQFKRGAGVVFKYEFLFFNAEADEVMMKMRYPAPARAASLHESSSCRIIKNFPMKGKIIKVLGDVCS